jgi:hypothetical protein
MTQKSRSGKILKTEIHLHLYGCLSAEDLLTIGKERWSSHVERLEWYASEYQKAFQRRPDYKQYWQSSHGLELLSNDFIIAGPLSFQQFQAKFNLLIALFPAAVHDQKLAETVLLRDSDAGFLGREYRTFLPPALPIAEQFSYLKGLARICANYNDPKGFKPRLSLSMSRDPAQLERQMELFLSWRNLDANIKTFVTSLDFCGYEEHDDIGSKSSIIKKIIARAPELSISFHVGETCNEVTPYTNLRRLLQLTSYGVRRFGHATVLGAEPSSYAQCTWQDPYQASTQAWLRAHWDRLIDFQPDLRRTEQFLLNRTDAWTFEPECFDLLQRASLTWVKSLPDVVIESCPTSNLRLGNLTSYDVHPIKRFKAEGIPFTVSTDDPGIFAISLEREEMITSKLVGFDALASCEALASEHFYI